MTWRIFCDAGTRLRNPSSSGYWGFTVWHDDDLMYAECGRLIGEVFSSGAELKAVEAAIKFISNSLILECQIFTDCAEIMNMVSSQSYVASHHLTDAIKEYIIDSQLTILHTPRSHTLQRFTDYVARMGNNKSTTFESVTELEQLKRGFFNGIQ